MKTGVYLKLFPYIQLYSLLGPPREKGGSPELVHSTEASAISLAKASTVT